MLYVSCVVLWFVTGGETEKDGTSNLKNNVSPAMSPSNKVHRCRYYIVDTILCPVCGHTVSVTRMRQSLDAMNYEL